MITKEESRDYKLGVWNYQIHTASAAAVTSVVSDSVRPHSRQPIRIPHPWESPGKNTEVSCHFLLQCIKVKSDPDHSHYFFFFLIPSSVQFSCSVVSLCNPMNHSTSGLPVHHQHPEFTQTHIHWVGDAIQPSHPLLSPSPPACNPSQHQGLFKWVSSLHEVAKVLELQL